jgi:hypothetical protein
MQLMPWLLILGYRIPGSDTKYVKRIVLTPEIPEPVPTPLYGYRNQVHGPLTPNQPPVPIEEMVNQTDDSTSRTYIGKSNGTRTNRDVNTEEPQVQPRRENKLLFDGLDCRSPTSVRNGLVTDICKGQKALGPVGHTETVVILQHATKRTAKAYRCQKKISRLQEVCGAFSHSKILGPPDILEPVPFSALDCQQTIKRGLYRTETGASVTVDINRNYNYKFIQHGKIQASTTNVACEGSSIIINGERHESVVSLVTVHLEFLEVEVEIDNDLAVDLDKNVHLPTDCVRRDLCEDGHTAYVIHHPLHACPLFLIRTVNMQKIPINTDKGIQQAFINKEHKLLLIIKPSEATDNECSPLRSVGGTQYPDLKILHSENTPMTDMKSIISNLGPSQLDLTLELITADEFLDYDLEQRMDQQLRAVGSSLCTMSRQNLHQTELSPFHKDSLIRIRGALVSELQCERVTVEARLGDQRGPHCYKDSLPVWVRNKPLHMLAVSGLIVEENTLTHIPCQNQFNSVFRTKDGIMVQADPDVQIVEGLQLQHIGEGYLHAFDNSPQVHSEYSSDLLYNNEQVGAFNNLLHFNRAKAHVLDSLVRQYCKKGANGKSQCGEYMPEGPGANGFDLGKLEREIVATTNWAQYAQNKLTEYGGYCSIVVVAYLSLALLWKIGDICFGVCFRNEDWKKTTSDKFLIDCTRKPRRKQGNTREMDTYSANTETTYAGREETYNFLGHPTTIRQERVRPLPRGSPNPSQHSKTGTKNETAPNKKPRYEEPVDPAKHVPEELYKEVPRRPRNTTVYSEPRPDGPWGV